MKPGQLVHRQIKAEGITVQEMEIVRNDPWRISKIPNKVRREKCRLQDMSILRVVRGKS